MKPHLLSIFSLEVSSSEVSWNRQLVSPSAGSQACSFMSGLGYLERVTLFAEEVLTQPTAQGY